jgi:hypothetical protein
MSLPEDTEKSSPNIIRVMKSRRMRWAKHIARMGDIRNAYKILVGKPQGKRPGGRSTRRWEIMLGLMLRKEGGKVWIGFNWLRIGTCGAFL